ncbi:oligosaccharide flippase family protein [Salmonella enterica]|nr:hypothetical protein [Salmonella enterica]EDP9076727.1 oligosaccharide flippase family protein [Salmonella enterica subsp. arizonae]EJU7780573.1 oligosaccharide flippase family protein [Salmonella enterica subsp. arizonae serovar 56:z36:-]HBJ6831479.1 oligosaccharide flippase family protein [Salmonella enterica subsp. arizonae serovar 56:z4,z23:-]EAX9063650.1 hypothetical protein [Salmonella enterica]
MAIVGIAIIPMYLSMLGSAGFGLVSFFTLLQTLLVVLDLGISSTLSREVAILKTESTYFSVFIKILTFVMLLFVFVSFMITFFMYIFRDTIATKWLNTSELSLNDVEYSLAIIGIIISLRWCAGPFKSVILGCEEQIKFNLVNIIVTTLRFIVVIPVMYYYGKNVRVFFTYQLVAAVVEFLLFFILFLYSLKGIKKLIPNKLFRCSISKEVFYNELKRIAKFSLGIAITSFIWIAVSQADKIILSKYLNISEYGMFSAAATIAGGILILSTPISQAILPRMSSLHSKGDFEGLYKVYALSTKTVVSLLAPIAFVMASNAKSLLFMWTANEHLANYSAQILVLYSLGNLFFAIAAFPYYLQYAFGKLKLHILGNFLFVIIIIPSLIFSIRTYGVIGAGYVWLIQNVFFMFFWCWFIHGRFIRTKRISWLFNEVVLTLLPSIVVISVFKWISFPATSERITLFYILASQCILAFLLTVIIDKRVRSHVTEMVKKIIWN